MNRKFKRTDEVKVVKILNRNKASHLVEHIGKIGYIYSYAVKNGIIKYKVVLDLYNWETAYFLEGELERVD